ncbi:MAG: hypothetical protein IPO98_22240 [Saprospiraceae bacterium]|nr:hypothetical protein [Saprospiraceae bacterium]
MNKEKLSEYWEKYKSLFDTPEFEQHEKYKWPVLAQCYEKWDWNAVDKATMFQKTFDVKGQKNLWMSRQFYPVRMIEQYYEIDAGKVNNNFNILFDETQDLTYRIDSFKKITNDLLLKLQETKPNETIEQGYHGDLRAISIYLSLQYPEKYYIYKHGVFKDFCKAIELPAVKSGQISNYIDYITVCEEILNFIRNDQEFLSQYKTFCSIPEYYNDPYLHLLVQDFIYTYSFLL